jgi:hypothetical protein
MTEIFKALLLINGGGAVALLTLVDGTSRPSLLVAAAQGALWLSGGLVLAVISAVFRFWHSLSADHEPGSSKQRSLRIAYLSLLVMSAACFAVGAAWTGTDGLTPLQQPNPSE